MTLTGMIEERIHIPEGVNVNIANAVITVTGPKGKLSRKLFHPRVKLAVKDSAVLVSSEMPRIKEKAMVGTFAAHINNMMLGVKDGWEYKMKIVYSHFPMKAYVKGDKFIIENFLGEKAPRRANILGDTKITVKGNEVDLQGSDIEAVGQTAANIEKATTIRGFDPRVFQDGIYITEKAVRKVEE